MLSKTVVIGDIHWRDTWRDIVEKEQPDTTIFIWDYFDSFSISKPDQIENFYEIVEYCEYNDWIMIIWNHDFMYHPNVNEKYSWFCSMLKMQVWDDIKAMINDGRLVACHEEWEYIFTHAWLSKTWMSNNNVKNCEEINQLLLEDLKPFWKQSLEPYWNDKKEWPLWIRENALHKDPYTWHVQVYWHTELDHISEVGNFINVDALELGEYLILEWQSRFVWQI